MTNVAFAAFFFVANFGCFLATEAAALLTFNVFFFVDFFFLTTFAEHLINDPQ